MKKKEVVGWLDTYKEEHGSDPNYIRCMVQFKEDESLSNVTIKLKPFEPHITTEEEDNQIFFYCNGRDEFLKLLKPDNGEDFYVCKIYWVSIKL